MDALRTQMMRSTKTKHPTGELWAVVPVKSLARSKQRLSESLGELRPGLTLAMLQDVLNALADARSVPGVIVVTRDAEVARRARACGAEVLDEAAPGGMNQAIAQGVDEVRRRGGSAAAIVPADVPLLTGPEFDRLAAAWRQADDGGKPVVGLVPAADGSGTNWLCFHTVLPWVPGYGPDSCRRHQQQADALGCAALMLDSPAVALDLDTAADLQGFLEFCHGQPAFQSTETWCFLERVRRDGAAPSPLRATASDESNYVCKH